MLYGPPRSILFPYTTLFRSSETSVQIMDLLVRLNREQRQTLVLVTHDAAVSSRAHRDRKSTRLNSSHLGISYAVFCLKKKTEQITGIEGAHGPPHLQRQHSL